MRNPRYVPPNANRRNVPQQRPIQNDQYRNNNDYSNDIFDSNDQYDQPMPSHQNGHSDHRGINHPPPQLHQNGHFDHRGMSHPPPQSHSNGHSDHRGVNHPPPQSVQKRVQIIDHNRQTPSVDYISERDSHNSYTPDFNPSPPKPKPRREPTEDNRSDSTLRSMQRNNNFKIHDYLYGLSAPDPGL